jgi:hypothetical protein
MDCPGADGNSDGAALSISDVNRPNGLGANSSNLLPPFTPVDRSGNTPQPVMAAAAPPTRPRRMELRTRLLLDVREGCDRCLLLQCALWACRLSCLVLHCVWAVND